MAIANTTIRIKKSLVSGVTPSSLANGEIAINQADGKLFYATPSGSISFINNQQSFATINANGSLLLASSTSDTLSFAAGNNITITGNTTSKTITINSAVEGAFNYWQNTAPTSANSHDYWTHSDTGVMYENFGTPSAPIWAEVGPTGLLANTLPGAVSASQLTVSYTPSTPTGAGIQVSAANTQGGTGYADFLKITNTSGGSTNATKWFRVNSTGGFEIINNAYSSQIFSASDAGIVNAGSQLNIGGKQAVNGPAFAAYQTVTQSIPTDVQTKLTFTTEDFDTNNCYTSSTFTPNVEGYYQISAAVRFDSNIGTGERMLVLYKNGSEWYRAFNTKGTAAVGDSWFQMTLSQLVYANGSTDYFEIYAMHGAGANRNTTANRAFTNFAGVMVRGA